MLSILVAIRDPFVRELVCGEITRGLRCPIYAASDEKGVLTLLQAEKPTILLITPEFEQIHGKAVAEVMADMSPETTVLVLPAVPRTTATVAE